MSSWLAWAVVAALCLAALLWPGSGLIARLRRRTAARRREQEDNVLKHLLHEAQAGRAATFASVQGTLRVGDRRVLRTIGRLRAEGLLTSDGATFCLSEGGEQRARHLVRAHRLLERYLVDEARLPVTAVHRVAERLEHRLSEADADRLSASLGHPERDPHGDPIPPAGESSADAGAPITASRAGDEGRIVHLEDEPDATYRRLVQLGLQPGQAFRVDDVDGDALHLRVEGRHVRLPLDVAGNVFAAPIEHPPSAANALVRLADLPTGAIAEIASLSPACQGFTRRRLLDLGFTPGTRVQPVLATFVGDPRAYRVRGTTIALRRDQAASLIVRTAAADAGTGACS